MAQPVDFHGSNLRLVAPSGHEGHVAALDAFHNGRVSVTCWQLTLDELNSVLRTGRLWLAVLYADTQPPVFVGDENSVRRVVADYGAVWRKEDAGN